MSLEDPSSERLGFRFFSGKLHYYCFDVLSATAPCGALRGATWLVTAFVKGFKVWEFTAWGRPLAWGLGCGC